MRRLLTALALLGCIIHAMVLPWWSASRLPAHWAAVTLENDLAVFCHNAASAPQADLPNPVRPDPTSECPICKGLVGLQFAILVAAQTGLLERVSNSAPLWVLPDDPREGVVFAPETGDRPSPSSIGYASFPLADMSSA